MLLCLLPTYIDSYHRYHIRRRDEWHCTFTDLLRRWDGVIGMYDVCAGTYIYTYVFINKYIYIHGFIIYMYVYMCIHVYIYVSIRYILVSAAHPQRVGKHFVYFCENLSFNRDRRQLVGGGRTQDRSCKVLGCDIHSRHEIQMSFRGPQFH